MRNITWYAVAICSKIALRMPTPSLTRNSHAPFLALRSFAFGRAYFCEHAPLETRKNLSPVILPCAFPVCRELDEPRHVGIPGSTGSFCAHLTRDLDHCLLHSGIPADVLVAERRLSGLLLRRERMYSCSSSGCTVGSGSFGGEGTPARGGPF